MKETTKYVLVSILILTHTYFLGSFLAMHTVKLQPHIPSIFLVGVYQVVMVAYSFYLACLSVDLIGEAVMKMEETRKIPVLAVIGDLFLFIYMNLLGFVIGMFIVEILI